MFLSISTMIREGTTALPHTNCSQTCHKCSVSCSLLRDEHWTLRVCGHARAFPLRRAVRVHLWVGQGLAACHYILQNFFLAPCTCTTRLPNWGSTPGRGDQILLGFASGVLDEGRIRWPQVSVDCVLDDVVGWGLCVRRTRRPFAAIVLSWVLCRWWKGLLGS